MSVQTFERIIIILAALTTIVVGVLTATQVLRADTHEESASISECPQS
jgi:hypothetical protein